MRNLRTQWRIVGGKHALEHGAHPARWVAPAATRMTVGAIVPEVVIELPIVPSVMPAPVVRMPSRLTRLDTFLTAHPNVQRISAVGAGLALGGVVQVIVNLIGG